MLADDLNELEKVFASQLERFISSSSIEQLLNYHPERCDYALGLKQLVLSIGTPEVRSRWKEDRAIPFRDGIVLSDGSVITSTITVKEIPQSWKAGNFSPVKPVVTLMNRNGEPWAIITNYSYSFYPNNSNAMAKKLGYFRYDFHPDTQGDGDFGSHPYFHSHRDFVNANDEQNEEIRWPTGLVHLSELLSLCERNLFPAQRLERLVRNLSNGEFDELALDLSPEGMNDLLVSHFSKTQWQKYKYRYRCMSFLKHSGWTLPVVASFEKVLRRSK